MRKSGLYSSFRWLICRGTACRALSNAVYLTCLIPFFWVTTAFAQSGTTAPVFGDTSLWMSAARLLGSLLLVLVLIWIVMRVARRTLKGRWSGNSKAGLRVVERLYLAPRKSVEVISVGRRLLLLGVTESQISTLAELDPEDLQATGTDNPTLSAQTTSAPTGDFLTQLRRRMQAGIGPRQQTMQSVPDPVCPTGKVRSGAAIATGVVVIALILSLLSPAAIMAQGLPKLSIGVEPGNSPSDMTVGLQILLLLTVLSLAPSLVVTMTSFTRIIVVLSFLKHALGTQQMPPSQLLVGLALILTIFIMMPVFTTAYEQGLKPYTEGTIDRPTALQRGMAPLREFMLKQTREKDLALFVDLAGLPKPETPDDIPLRVLVPGFVISELRVAFQIGFILFIPFLIIDMVVASVLMSMGMLMLPPVMVAMPFKILLFVLVDGWYLLVQSLVASFR